MSIFSKVRVPKQQKMGEINLEKENVLLLGSGIFSAGFMNLFPGLGPAQAAIMSSSFFKKLTPRNYLFLIGCINAVSMLMALITLYTISKARNGSIAVAGIFLGKIGFNELVFILIIALVVSCLAVILVIRLIPIFILLVSYVNYQKLCFGILFIIIFFVILFSGLVGLVILVTGTFIGITAHLARVGKHHAMSCLIIPIVISYILF
jgi:putative membrane protein